MKYKIGSIVTLRKDIEHGSIDFSNAVALVVNIDERNESVRIKYGALSYNYAWISKKWILKVKRNDNRIALFPRNKPEDK